MKKKGTNRLVITDQGNGGRYCSKCKKELPGPVNTCPFCKAELEIDSNFADFGNHDPGYC